MQSMTGFAREEKIIDGHQLTIETKSVNHRYLDLRFRLPSGLQMHENALAELVRKKISRGSIDISIRQRIASEAMTFEGNTRFIVDEAAAKSFANALALLTQKFQVPAAPTAELLLSTGKIVVPVEQSQENKLGFGAIRELFEQVLDTLVQERNREGSETRKSLKATLSQLLSIGQEVKTLAADHPQRIRERLQKRIAQWALESHLDTARLEVEVAYFADRADISEEIQRFEAHLAEFSKLLDLPQPQGRKLDFLTQELHRETNTIASKADDLKISRIAVEAKTAIEKLREQVQNVE